MAEICQFSEKTCEWLCDLDAYAPQALDAAIGSEALSSVGTDEYRAKMEEAFVNLLIINALGDFKCTGRLSPQDEFKTLEVMSVDGVHVDEYGIDCPVLIELFKDEIQQQEKNYEIGE